MLQRKKIMSCHLFPYANEDGSRNNKKSKKLRTSKLAPPKALYSKFEKKTVVMKKMSL